MFIELTRDSGEKFLANVTLIQRVVESKDEKKGTYISGLTNNGGFYVKESYQEIKTKIIKCKGIIN